MNRHMTVVALTAALGLAGAASAHGGGAHVELKAPPGAELLIDGKSAGTFDRQGRLELQLSPERHQLAIRHQGRVVSHGTVEFGSGSQISLDLTDHKARDR